MKLNLNDHLGVLFSFKGVLSVNHAGPVELLCDIARLRGKLR